MSVHFTPEAAAELEQVLDYIAGHSISGAGKVRRRIQDVLRYVSSFPASGYTTNVPNLRRVAVTPYPYVIYYISGKTEITVIGVRHAARDPDTMPDAP